MRVSTGSTKHATLVRFQLHILPTLLIIVWDIFERKTNMKTENIEPISLHFGDNPNWLSNNITEEVIEVEESENEE